MLSMWLRERPFTLALSSGLFGFYAHAGLLTALLEEGLEPADYSGSSAGALVAGCFASGMSLDTMRDLLFKLRRQDFWDPRPGLGLLRGKLFHQLLVDALPVQQIQACPKQVQISVFDVWRRRTEILRDGDLPTAIRASCAMPLLFHPVRRQGRLLMDGGIADWAGVGGLPTSARVLHHHLIPSKVWGGRGAIKSKYLPAHRQAQTIVVDNLASVSPFRLDAGQQAFQQAYKAMRRVLRQPLAPNNRTLVTSSQ